MKTINLSAIGGFIARYSGYLIVFGLMGFYIFDILLYYVGFHTNEKLQHTSLITLSIVIFVIALFRLWQIYVSETGERRKILLLCLYPLGGALIFIAAFLLYGTIVVDRGLLYFLQFGCFGIPAFIFGIDCALNQKETVLFKSMGAVSIFFLPMAIWFIGWLSFKSIFNIPYEDAIGGMAFMTLAYALMCVFLFLSLAILTPMKRTAIEARYWTKSVSDKLRLGLALFFWFVILAAATRGAQMCVFLFFIAVLLLGLYIRNRGIIIRALGMMAASIIVFIFIMFIIQPKFMELSLAKNNIVIESSAQGKIVTSKTVAVDDNTINEIIVKPIVDKNRPDLSKLIMNREQLYRIALGEFVKNPVAGIGPIGFIVKYGRYPHNVILEVLCDYGMVGGILIFGTILFCLIKLIKCARSNSSVWIMTLILIGFNLPLLFSGEFLAHAPFWFFIGYSIMLKPGNRLKQPLASSGGLPIPKGKIEVKMI